MSLKKTKKRASGIVLFISRVSLLAFFIFQMGCIASVNAKRAQILTEKHAIPKFQMDFKCNERDIKEYEFEIFDSSSFYATIIGCGHKVEYKCTKIINTIDCSVVEVSVE